LLGEGAAITGHDHISTNGDVTSVRFGTKDAKCLVDFVACQQLLPFIYVECDEIARPDNINDPESGLAGAVAIVSYSCRSSFSGSSGPKSTLSGIGMVCSAD
jgi:hypothetical protein